ncbi:MAG: hypothetical protein JXB42_09290 [Deltaproteobacteria bacterium]|nr:hypothetical protein [Deltaproteobacteria bacterium]
MKYEETDVKCYSGYKFNERPQSFTFQDRTLEVSKIVDRWYESGPGADQPALSYFKIHTGDGEEFILRYDSLFNAWGILLK